MVDCHLGPFDGRFEGVGTEWIDQHVWEFVCDGNSFDTTLLPSLGAMVFVLHYISRINRLVRTCASVERGFRRHIRNVYIIYTEI
jgi:hypothetical protein